jgi:hypothetical protein
MRSLCVASANLRMIQSPKILEHSDISLTKLGKLVEIDLQIVSVRMDFSDMSRRGSAVAVDAQIGCTMAEDDGVRFGVNVTLPHVTNYRIFQCLS